MRQLLRTDNVGVLSERWDSKGFARQLLLKEAAESRLEGRALIYGCRECLDLDCGGIAAKVMRVGKRIRWESLERYWVDHEQDRFVFKPIDVDPMEFDFDQYCSTLEPFLV